MEDTFQENLTTRSLLKGILATESVRPSVKHLSKQSALEYGRLSTSAYLDRTLSSPSMSLRSKMKDGVRRSLGKVAHESSTIKRKVEIKSSINLNSGKKASPSILEDIDKITPGTLLKKIIQNEDEVSIVLSQKAKTAVDNGGDDEIQETTSNAGLSSALEYGRLSTSAYLDRTSSSPSINLRSKMKDRVRRSLGKSAHESSTIKRKVEIKSRIKQNFGKKASPPILEDLDKITPRTLLKKIIQNEDEVSIIVSQKAKTAIDDDDDVKQETNSNARLSSVGNVNLSLPDLQEKEHVKVFRNFKKKRRIDISDFEREVDERLPKNRDDTLEDKIEASSSSGSSYTMPRSLENKLDISSIPQSTYKSGLLRRPNKMFLVSLRDFEQGVEDKYRKLKGSQECFIESIAEDKADYSSNEVAQMDTALYAQPLLKEITTPNSDKTHQRKNKNGVSANNEREEAGGVFAENERGETVDVFESYQSDEAEDVIANYESEKAEDVIASNENEEAEDILASNENEEAEDVIASNESEEAEDVIASNESEEAEDVLVSDESEEAEDVLLSDESEEAEDVKASHENEEAEDVLVSDESEEAEDVLVSDESEKAEDAIASEEREEAEDILVSEEREEAEDILAETDTVSVNVQPKRPDQSIKKSEALMKSPTGIRSNGGESEEIDPDIMDVESSVQYEQNQSSVIGSGKLSGLNTSSPKMQNSRRNEGNSHQTAQSINVAVLSVPGKEDTYDSSHNSTSGNLLAQSHIGIGDSTLKNKKTMNKHLIFTGPVETPSYIKNARFTVKNKPAAGKNIQKKKTVTTKKEGTAIPASLVKQIFGLHTKMRVSKESLTEVEKCLELYFDQMSGDLAAYCAHAGRKMITCGDVELLMKRQRLVTDTTSLNVLIEKHLPLDCRKLLIPCAMSGNKVYPKI